MPDVKYVGFRGFRALASNTSRKENGPKLETLNRLGFEVQGL